MGRAAKRCPSVQALLSRKGEAICSPNTAAYCKARVSIPIRLLIKIHRRLVDGMCPRRLPRTFVIDGTTGGMPDSMANQAIRAVTLTVDPGVGFRTTEINLASTVTDPEEMTATETGSLYLERSKVELFIDDLKTTLGMGVLTSRSPAMIRRELIVRIIAYNLLRALMDCGKTAGCENPSFKGTIDRLNNWLPVVLSATTAKLRKRLVTDLIELIAEDQVPERPYRREPRAVKRRPHPHQLLNKLRHKMIARNLLLRVAPETAVGPDRRAGKRGLFPAPKHGPGDCRGAHSRCNCGELSG